MKNLGGDILPEPWNYDGINKVICGRCGAIIEIHGRVQDTLAAHEENRTCKRCGRKVPMRAMEDDD